MFHKNSSLGDQHIIHNWEYATAADRTAATGFTATDLKKIAFQTDTNTFWVLTSIAPSWTAVGGTVSGGGSGSGGAVSSVNTRIGDVVVTKADVGLSVADNTSDANKPVSTAQAAATALKANQSTTYTKTETDSRIQAIVGAAPLALDTLVEIAAQLATDESAVSSLITTVGTKAPLASPTFTGTVSGVTASMVGLGSVDNTSDINKPVSTAQGSANASVQSAASTDATNKANAAQSASAPLSHTHAAVTTSVTGFMSATDKVKLDGIQAGATAGGGGMTNPMTTLGDIIVGGAAGAPTKLGIGVEGQVVKIVGGAIIWGSPAAATGSVDWPNVTNKPAFGTASLVDTTTLTPIAHVGTGGTAHAAVTTTTNGFMSSTDKSKLDAVSGSNTGDQVNITGNANTVTNNANMTGDVTSVGNATTIPANTVTFSKIANIASGTFLARSTAATGNVEAITAANAKTLLALTKSDVGLTNVDNTSDVNKPVSTAQATADTAIQTAASTDATNKANAAKTYADGLVVGLWDDRGSYNASGNAFPTTGGSGSAGAVLKGDIWTVSVAGTLGGVAVIIGDTVRALSDSPAQATANWSTLKTSIGYVPENIANKDATGGYAGLTLFKLNLRNAANSITSWFTTAAIVARTWTMPDKDGIVAMTSDITGTNSGLNTGDQTTISGNAATATLLSAGADRTKLDAVLGTNTGDETLSTIKTKLSISVLSGSNTGDQTTITGNAGSTNGLKTATTTVAIDTATAPTAGQSLVATSSTAATWQTIAAAVGMTNPMTTAGDTIVGGVAGTAQRLGIGADGQIAKVSGGTVAWGVNNADWANLTNKPVFGTAALVDTTTLTPIAHVGTGGTAHAAVTTSVNGFMLSTDKTKIDAITGLNTGDDTAATIRTKLAITTLSGSNTGDQTTITGNAGSASGLKTATTTVVIDTATAPTVGQTLVATSTTAATWQTPAAGGGSITYNENNASTLVTYPQSTTPVLVDSMTLTPTAGGTFRGEASIQFSASPALVAAQCNTDLNALVTQINGLTGFVAHGAAYGAGEVLLPGRYYIAGATTHTGNLAYDAQGNSDAMWIIKCGAAHAVAAAATVTLINGAKASNIFWLIVGAPTIGAACTLKGTYIGNSAIAPGDVFNFEGRIFTQTGAITTSNTTYTVPVGEPLVLNLGILKSFVFFTPAGAIANTVVTGGTGDVATGGGAVTGFGTINGTVYLPTDINSKVTFQLYQNNVAIASTLRTSENRLYAPAQSTILLGLPVISTTQAITVKVKVDVGSVTVSNRSLYALKLS